MMHGTTRKRAQTIVIYGAPQTVFCPGHMLPALGELVKRERAQGAREQVRGAESTRHATAVQLHEEGRGAAAAEHCRARAVQQLPPRGGEACEASSIRGKAQQQACV